MSTAYHFSLHLRSLKMIGICLFFVIPGVFATETFFASESFFPRDTVEVFSSKRPEIMARIENYPSRNDPTRKFLTNYNSLRPVGLLVDDTKESLNSANEFIKNLFNITARAQYITFYVLKFNSTGTTPLTEIQGTDSTKLYNILSYKPKDHNLELGNIQPDGTVAFFASLQAASALPTDTAIIIFVDRKINDEDLAGQTSLFKKKNIKVYTVWGGPYPTQTHEERLLKELCSYSGGLFLINDIKDLSGYNYRNYINNYRQDLNTSIILARYNLTDDSTITFPIDSEVNYIHILISPATVQGTLTTPTGEHVEITENESIASYGTGSFGFSERGQREIFLDATQGVGVWSFHVKASVTSVPCNVKVYVRTKLTAHAYFIRENTGITNKTKILKLDFTGHLGKINNISFIGYDGNVLSDKLKYNIMETDTPNKEVDIEVINAPENSNQVKVDGTDIKGNHFSRLTYISNYTDNTFLQPILLIDVALGSELIIVTGGGTSVITFEVTNLRNTAADTRFYCRDEKSILGSMQPYRKIISPQETTIVTLVLTTRYGVYQDLITFTAAVGSDYVEKKLIVDVGSQIKDDNEPPSLEYTYLSDCSKVIFSSCDQGTWTIEAKAKDQGSGLLQLTSNPRGLYFQNGFISGTKEEVTGIYSSSCCKADLQLTATDRVNNRRTVTTNAYRATWGPGQIAALVLGILLFILLIALIIYLIVKCVKKRREYKLSTYRGGGI